jgi:hypothetical protein
LTDSSSGGGVEKKLPSSGSFHFEVGDGTDPLMVEFDYTYFWNTNSNTDTTDVAKMGV